MFHRLFNLVCNRLKTNILSSLIQHECVIFGKEHPSLFIWQESE